MKVSHINVSTNRYFFSRLALITGWRTKTKFLSVAKVSNNGMVQLMFAVCFAFSCALAFAGESESDESTMLKLFDKAKSEYKDKKFEDCKKTLGQIGEGVDRELKANRNKAEIIKVDSVQRLTALSSKYQGETIAIKLYFKWIRSEGLASFLAKSTSADSVRVVYPLTMSEFMLGLKQKDYVITGRFSYDETLSRYDIAILNESDIQEVNGK